MCVHRVWIALESLLEVSVEQGTGGVGVMMVAVMVSAKNAVELL